MHSWFDIKLHKQNRRNATIADDVIEVNETELSASRERFEKIIGAEIRSGVPPSRIFLLGFSQGGALALNVFLRTQYKVGGLMGISCWLPLQTSYAVTGTNATAGSDIQLQHVRLKMSEQTPGSYGNLQLL